MLARPACEGTEREIALAPALRAQAFETKLPKMYLNYQNNFVSYLLIDFDYSKYESAKKEFRQQEKI